MTTANIELSTPVNLRDLGGIPIAGGVLSPGLAIRTDDLAYVTEEYAQGLIEAGLTAIIDLRSPLEVSITGRGPLANYPIGYHHLPLIADIGNSTPRSGHQDLTHESMGRMYLGMLEGAAPQFVTALNVIAYSPGATAFHCAAGRDRTGVLAAMLLLALGAAEEDIVSDYVRTGENMRAIMARSAPVMGAMWRALGFDPAGPQSDALLQGSMDVSMRSLLAALHERHGSPLTPLRTAGLSDATIARLRERALGA